MWILRNRAVGSLPLYHVSILVAAMVVQCGQQESPTSSGTQSLPMAQISFSEPFAYDFGLVSVGTAKFQTITLTNTGEARATGLESSFVTAAFSYLNGFPGTGGDCGESLDPEESCDIVIRFSPPLATSYLELLRVTYFNGVEEVTTKLPTIEGKGVAP